MQLVKKAVADLGRGAPGARPDPPPRPKMFSISCSFSEILTKSYVGAPLRGSAPPPTGNPGSAPGSSGFSLKIITPFMNN